MAEMRLVSDQVISIILGIGAGLLILHPPFMEEKAQLMKEKLENDTWEILIILQVFIIPPIIYESSLLMIKKSEVLSKIGSVFLSQLISVLTVTALFSGLLIVTGLSDLLRLDNSSGANMLLILSLIIQLNDYSGTLDPHISFNMENSSTLSFLST